MKKSIWLSALLCPFIFPLAFAQENTTPNSGTPTVNNTINNNFYGPVIINQGNAPQQTTPPVAPEQPTQQPNQPVDQAQQPAPVPPVSETVPSQDTIQPVFTAVKPRPKTPSFTLGIKGTYFYDHDKLTSDVERYNWVVAPGGEFGVFADVYLNRFILTTYELMWARDIGYISTGETVKANSMSFNAMFKLRAPIAPRFALTGGVGVYYSLGTIFTSTESEFVSMRGLLTEFAAETSFGAGNQHVFTLGMRNKWRFDQLKWNSIKQQPVGIMASYGYRW